MLDGDFEVSNLEGKGDVPDVSGILRNSSRDLEYKAGTHRKRDYTHSRDQGQG